MRITLRTHVDVWNNFKLITVDNKERDYAVCCLCLQVVTYKKKDGTKGLHTHTYSDKESSKVHQLKMTTFTKKSVLQSLAAESFKDNMVNFVTVHLRPFIAIEGKGFLLLSQMLVDYGAK